MPRPNSNPGRLNDTSAIRRIGINSPPPLESDYVMGCSFSKCSPGRNTASAPPTRHPDTGQFSSSSIGNAVEYLRKP